MTLGFTVEELLPHARVGGALRMGLIRLAPSAWLRSDPESSVRAAAFDRHPDAVQRLPGARAAEREAAALVGAGDDLGGAARVIWEDLCLLQERDGAFVLAAGAVAFPTDWRLADKLGLPLAAVHAPIHGYAGQLAAGVDHFLRTVRPGAIFGRVNAFVVPTDGWRYLPGDDPAARFAHVDAGNAGRTLFVRCERQTIRRLPASGAILFTIGIAVARLDSLPPPAIRRLAAGEPIAGERERRGTPAYADALAGYAASLPTGIAA